jgi:hypothetical protein
VADHYPVEEGLDLHHVAGPLTDAAAEFRTAQSKTGSENLEYQ